MVLGGDSWIDANIKASLADKHEAERETRLEWDGVAAIVVVAATKDEWMVGRLVGCDVVVVVVLTDEELNGAVVESKRR
jgi:hypothetical protein